ncbi:MAG: aldehyde dehydrogenase family protein, partial [Pedobacter sp.]
MSGSIARIFKKQQVHKFNLRKTKVSERIRKLKILKEAIRSNEHAIYSALAMDLGKSEFEAAVTEVIFIYGELDFAISHLKGWMRPKRAPKMLSNIFAGNRVYY